MIGTAIDIPDFKECQEVLKTPTIAREFLLQIKSNGYVLEELIKVYGEHVDINHLHDNDVVILAQMYWPIVFLNEYPDYGDFEH